MLPVFSKGFRGAPVGHSRDLNRIVELPKRPLPSDAALEALVEKWTRKLGKGDVFCNCETLYRRRCCKRLGPVQAWALEEMSLVGGLLGPIGVGYGKTLLDLLAALAVDSKVAVLLLPPQLKRQLLEVDLAFYGQHWTLPNIGGGRWFDPTKPFLHVVAYSELSSPKASDLLRKLNPDTIICDEAHSLRHRVAARTKRFLRHCAERKGTRLLAWSGTLTSKSLRDYAHLSALALGDNSPVPLHPPVVEEWAAAVDPAENQAPPGALKVFDTGNGVRAGLRDRLVGTLGVVASPDRGSCEASLTISQRRVAVPEKVQKALIGVEATWQRPDGEELVEALELSRVQRQVAAGFYYKWIFPRGEPKPVVDRWKEIRAAWHKAMREKLKHSSEQMDSPKLLGMACHRWFYGYVHIERDPPVQKFDPDTGEPIATEPGREKRRWEIPPRTRTGPLPVWACDEWLAWKAVEETVQPETEPVWIDEFLVDDAAQWLAGEPGIAWYEFATFGEKLARKAKGAVYAGVGDKANGVLLELRGDVPLIASIKAHGTGKNLQAYNRNLIMHPMADGGAWEQLLGRTHRDGQLSDEVTVDYYGHSVYADAVAKAREYAAYIQGTFGGNQKLVSTASWLDT